jgi:hypothetical protein
MIGMLWFDADPKKSLEDKIAEAAAAYRAKYGTEPTHCLAHPVETGATAPLGIALEFSRSIRPNHLLIGVKEQEHGIQASL